MGIALKGKVYAKADLATGDGARRFETVEKFLTWAFIRVSGNSQDFGDVTSQPVTVTAVAGVDYFVLENVDISTLYFKNTGAGANGTVSIVGVEASYED